MPGKSGRGRGRYSSRSKKRKGRRGSPAIIAQQQAVAPTRESAVLPKVPAPAVGEPAPTARPALARYPYISTELWRIGVLAGIMVAILVVLAFLLP